MEHQFYFVRHRFQPPAQHIGGRTVVGLPRVQPAQVEIGLKIIWLQSDRALVERHRRIQPLLPQANIAQQIMRLGQCRIERDRPVECLDGPIQVPLIRVEPAQTHPGQRKIAVDSQHALIAKLGFRI